MACGGCGSVRGMTKPEVSNYIQELIDQHKLQVGLNNCENDPLPRGAKVVLCDKLAGLICDLIETEKVCFPTVETLAYDADTETLTLTFGGQDYTTHIRVKGSNVTGGGKAGVYTIYQDGKEVVKIDTGVQDVKIEDGKLKVSKSGEVENEYDIPFTPAPKFGRGITQNGGKHEVDLADYVDNKTVRLKDGKLEVIKEKCAVATNLNTLEASDGSLKQLGNTCFTGLYSATSALATLGVPVALDKTDVETSNAVNDSSDAAEGIELEFNGWQIATGYEVTQYIYTRVEGGKQSGWVRSNASGMNADGTLRNPDDWGKWVYELNLPEQPAPVAGLDCAAIDALPERPWKKGTVLLAKQDGECVRLTAFDSIFQEVGVGITADKTNAFTNEEYKVVVTVSNTGEGKNELTNLNIVGPANTEDYEIKDVSFTKSEADEVEQVNNLTYNIRGLKKGGAVKVKYTVVPKVLGNYQFTAAVNPNSALDKDLGNNNATLILNARIKDDDTYVPSVDCPLITATELDSNTVLQQLLPNSNTSIGGRLHPIASVAAYNRANIFSQRRTLKGLRIKLDGASTVVGYKTRHSAAYSGVPVGDGTTAGIIVRGDVNDNILFDAEAEKSGTGGYSFSDGILEITEDILFFAFSCRPRGNNCRWQNYAVFSTVLNARKEINATNIIGATVTKDRIYADSVSKNSDGKTLPLVIPQSDKGLLRSDLLVHGVTEGHPAQVGDKLIVTVRAGTAASLNYTSTDNYAATQVQGKTTITENSITVAANAEATDSVNTKYIQVIVED